MPASEACFTMYSIVREWGTHVPCVEASGHSEVFRCHPLLFVSRGHSGLQLTSGKVG